MDYYMLRSTGEYASVSGVVDSAGVLLDEEASMQDELYIGWPIFPGVPLGDLLCDCNPLLVSPSAEDVIGRFRLPNDARWFSARIIDRDSKAELGIASGILFDPLIDVMDEGDLEVWRNAGLYRESTRPFVIRNALKGLDLVYGLPLGAIVSEKLKDAIEATQLTNFEFYPVQRK